MANLMSLSSMVEKKDFHIIVAEEGYHFNRENYRNNLLDLKILLDYYGVKFLLAFGTLLGAIRDHDFIDGDSDIDIFIVDEFKDNLILAISSEEFKKTRFKVLRVLGEDLITIGRNQAYIDISIFKDKNQEEMTLLNRHTIKSFIAKNPKTIQFIGEEFLIPSDAEDYLCEKYGDWRIKNGKHCDT